MECKKIKKLLQLYIDNTLTSGEKQMVKKHLKGCPTCRARLKPLYSIVKIIESLPEISPPPDFPPYPVPSGQKLPGPCSPLFLHFSKGGRVKNLGSEKEMRNFLSFLRDSEKTDYCVC